MSITRTIALLKLDGTYELKHFSLSGTAGDMGRQELEAGLNILLNGVKPFDDVKKFLVYSMSEIESLGPVIRIDTSPSDNA